MSRQQIAAQYARLLARWPKDPLRPETNMVNLLRKRVEIAPTPFRSEEKELNAAYVLLDNTITKQYPTPKSLLTPRSVPSHYTDLAKALEEAPTRSWLDNFKQRLRGLVRFK